MSSRSWRTRTAGVSAVLTASLVLAACSGGGGDESASGAAVTIVTAAQTQSFANDWSGTGYEAAEYFMNTGATLIRNPYVEGSDGLAAHQDLYDFEPLLAESYEASDDGLTYTFHLDPDALSTAGNSLDADDVLFSMERKFLAPTAFVEFISSPIITSADQFEKIDDMTVAVTVAEPGYGFTLLSLLANWMYAVYDSDVLLEHATDDDPWAVEWSASNHNWGFGAYEVTDYTAGEQIVFEANPGFVGGEPAVTRVVQRVVADAGQRANLLGNGDADIATQLRPADQQTIEEDGTGQIFDVHSNAMVYVPLTTTLAPFDDVAVRQALSHAIPYEAIFEDVYRGRMSALTGILDSTAPGYVGDGLEPWTYDPDTAKEILEDAGYTEPVAFTLTVNNSYPDLQETAVQIQSAAADAGFDVTIDTVNNATFQEGLASKTFQASMGRDYAIVQSPPYVLGLFYTPGSVINWPDWDDAEFNQALVDGNAAGDPLSDEAGLHWNQAQLRIQEDVPTIWFGSVQPLNAFANQLDGYVFRTDNVIDYSQLSIG
ncbi:ABC transporter substrate-binding protein [Microbacterium sp. 18062]|uniref:ABC transporter substrate-binding protein n=1 Tax=Microbacterium sp. 18062 TaxID=2681410 RepID=UPI00135A6A13|nr:ABC transporter substrate-binding protein [Microbacterium sp. 18062]